MEKRKILVIDDDPLVLESIRILLREAGYEVDVTPSGRQGLEWAVGNSYDAVLTDVRIPDIGGMLVLRDIKRAKPSLPVIVMTGYASVRSAVEAMRLGATDYLEKPFAPDEFLGSVDAVVAAAATRVQEKQEVIHKEEILQILDRATTDSEFEYNLAHHWAEALEGYPLTPAEKLALLTGDVDWIEKQAGPLTKSQKRRLERPLSAEMLKLFGW